MAACEINPRLTVSAGYVRGLADFAERQGACRGELLERAGVSPGALTDQDGRIALPDYVALMRWAARLTGDPAIALHYGQGSNLSANSVVGLICGTAATLGDSIALLNRYIGLVIETENRGDGARFDFADENGRLWMIDTRLNANAFPELTETAFAQLVHGARANSGSDESNLIAAHVTHPRPDHGDEYERVLGVPVTFGAARNALVFSGDWTAVELPLASPYVSNILRGYADTLLESLRQTRTVRGRVEAVMIARLCDPDLSVQSVARELGMSRQTLYRRLKTEGMSYEAVLDDLRRRLALSCLEGRGASVAETAYQLGFSDPSAFSRAFKRWTGVSPGQWGGDAPR